MFTYLIFAVVDTVIISQGLVLTLGILTGNAGGKPAPHSAFGWVAFLIVFAVALIQSPGASWDRRSTR